MTVTILHMQTLHKLYIDANVNHVEMAAKAEANLLIRISGWEQNIALVVMMQTPKTRSEAARENMKSVVRSSRNVDVLAITIMTRLLRTILATALKLMAAT